VLRLAVRANPASVTPARTRSQAKSVTFAVQPFVAPAAQ
jgi:hypothetical protein